MAKLHFYYSAMNAGKSTILLQAAFNYKERGMNVLLFTPKVDDRFEVGKVTSRIGLQADAIPFDNDLNFFTYIESELQSCAHPLKCIFVDEAQFLSRDQVYQLSQVSDHLRLPVLAYGLRTDFRGEPFEGSKYLLCWAEDLIEIKTICHCGRKAIMNLRINENGEAVWEGSQIAIEGKTRYTSLCRKHFWQGKSERDA